MIGKTAADVAPPAGGYVAGCAQLAARHWLAFITWCDLEVGKGRYRVNVRMGSRGGPFPHWSQVYPVATPIDEALERVAATAWGYFTSTGYAPPPAGATFSGADLEWAPSHHVVDFSAEDQERRDRHLAANQRRLRAEHPPADRRR